jgi:hypothetical protein
MKKMPKSMIGDIGFNLYRKILGAFVTMVRTGGWGITAEDISEIIKTSNDGKREVKNILSLELIEYEARKRIFDLL